MEMKSLINSKQNKEGQDKEILPQLRMDKIKIASKRVD